MNILYGIVFGLILTVVLIGCESPQGPTKKELIKSALSDYYQGEEFEKRRELEKAENAYLASIEVSPRPRAWYRLAEVERALGKFGEAKYAVKSAMRMVPDYPEARLLNTELDTEYPDVEPKQPPPSIQTIATSGEKQAAQEEQEDQSFVGEMDQRSDREIQEEGIGEHEIREQTIQEEFDSETKQKLEEAKWIASQGDWNTAADIYENLNNQHPENPQILYPYGYSLFNLGQYSKAEQLFRKTIQYDSDNASAYNDLGVTLEALGQQAEAMEAYQKAVDIGQHVDAYYNLAVLKEKFGEYKTAVKLYEEYLKYDSVSSYAQYARERIQTLRLNAY